MRVAGYCAPALALRASRASKASSHESRSRYHWQLANDMKRAVHAQRDLAPVHHACDQRIVDHDSNIGEKVGEKMGKKKNIQQKSIPAFKYIPMDTPPVGDPTLTNKPVQQCTRVDGTLPSSTIILQSLIPGRSRG